MDNIFYSNRFCYIKKFLKKLIIIDLSILILFSVIIFYLNIPLKYAFGFFLLINFIKFIIIHHYVTYCYFYEYLLKNNKTNYEN